MSKTAINTYRIAPFPLRIQPEMREQLEQAASANGTSLNGQIEQILKEWCETWGDVRK